MSVTGVSVLPLPVVKRTTYAPLSLPETVHVRTPLTQTLVIEPVGEQLVNCLLYTSGHDASKVELLILGGTWSAYSRDYREWFVQRCFDAMNAAGDSALAPSTSLAEAQARNVTARHRNVGLVIETRPDWITPEEIVHLRRLGVTKVQIGVQLSLIHI